VAICSIDDILQAHDDGLGLHDMTPGKHHIGMQSGNHTTLSTVCAAIQ